VYQLTCDGFPQFRHPGRRRIIARNINQGGVRYLSANQNPLGKRAQLSVGTDNALRNYTLLLRFYFNCLLLPRLRCYSISICSIVPGIYSFRGLKTETPPQHPPESSRTLNASIAMSSTNPFLLQYSTTPLDAIEPVHARLTQTFLSGKTRDLEFRKTQLRKLYYAIVDNRAYIHAALKADLNKPTLEASMGETTWLEKDIMKTLGKLDEWAKPETPETDFMYKFMGPKITKCPMGTVLIIGYAPPPPPPPRGCEHSPDM
jgi:hypothetical protein